MRPFRIETRLDASYFGGGTSRLVTRINRSGENEIAQAWALGYTAAGDAFHYALERHFHAIKEHILNQSRDEMFRESPEYQRMKAKLDRAEGKLDDISVIADPGER